MSRTGVVHELAKSRFTLTLDGKNVALLQYAKQNNVYDLFHTEVPSVYRGKGVGADLVKQALDVITKDPQAKIIPSCSFVQKIVAESGEKYASRVVNK